MSGSRPERAALSDLHFDGERNGIDDAGEFHQRAVAHELDSAPVMLGRLRLSRFPGDGP